MRYRLFIALILLLASKVSLAQHIAARPIRIVDTLTIPERETRNPIILRSELDSLIQQWALAQPQQQVSKEPEVQAAASTDQYIITGLIVIIALLVFAIIIFYRNHQKVTRSIAILQEKSGKADPQPGANGTALTPKDKKQKASAPSLENRIADLNAELNKLSKENDGLNRVIKEYNGIQHEYDSLKHRIQNSYKVRNYPGYDKSKNENSAMQGVLDIESAVAAFAYEKFLKPILSITDSNKNNPAKISAAERERLLDLMVSLSLLYIEYLYLRVNDLSIGGKMVERIHAVSKGKAPDAALLKQLNTEFGSRALVIKMTLEKIGLGQLTYPVFDETNLNNH